MLDSNFESDAVTTRRYHIVVGKETRRVDFKFEGTVGYRNFNESRTIILLFENSARVSTRAWSQLKRKEFAGR